MTLVGCDASQTSSSESTTFGASSLDSVSDCIEKFATGGEVWGASPVRASFVYDLTEATELENDDQVWKRQPGAEGTHSVTIHNGDGSAKAAEEFLKSTPKGNIETFSSDSLSLVRVNDTTEARFEGALRLGCERLRDGVTIRQVTFFGETS